MKIEKALNPAEEFIKYWRMRYAGLFKSDLSFLLRILSSSEYEWHEGLIRQNYKSEAPLQLTEEGWRSMANNNPIPTSWCPPHSLSALLNIPDDAQACWLHEIDLMCYRVEKLRPETVRRWISCREEFSGTREPYAADNINRNYGEFLKVQEVVPGIRARIRTIEQERQPKYVRPPSVEVGARVRYRTGSETALVVRMERMPLEDGEIRSVAILDHALEGIDIHLASNLVPVVGT